MHDIYIWTHHDLPVENHGLIHAVHAKEGYLNIPFFVIRAVIYFAIWFALAYFLNKWSLEQDRTGAQRWSDKMNTLSGPGLVIFILAVTFASVDWVMSLEPEVVFDDLRLAGSDRLGAQRALVCDRVNRGVI
ncbi:MAG: hypothetical protein WKF84_05090 [Pyrinomonadaceae bacterium]